MTPNEKLNQVLPAFSGGILFGCAFIVAVTALKAGEWIPPAAFVIGLCGLFLGFVALMRSR